MRIAVVGASGRTGRLFAALAHRSGHEVIAVVRDATRMPAGEIASVVESPATDVEGLVNAVEGADAVALCVGPVKSESITVQQESAAAVAEAMNRTGVRRLIAISASGGIVAGDDPISRWLAKPILRRVLRDSNADMAEMERIIRATDTEWTIVRPPRLTDGAAKGRYHQRRDGNVRWRYMISRADLAQALLDALLDDSSIGQTISVAN